MEQLTKAVQRLDRRLKQLDSRDHKAERSEVNYERTGPIEGGLRQGPRRVGPDRQNHASDRRCFNCGRKDHFARNCDQARSTGPSGIPQAVVENVNSVRAIGRNPRKVYLEVHVDGARIDCLLDTGSEVTLIPGFFVQGLPKRPVLSQIKAANGTLIEVLGEVDLPVTLKGKEMFIRGVASDHVAELLLGIDWLETNGAVWDLRRGELYMQGLIHALKPKTNGGWVRRVVVQDTVSLPTRSEVDVAGRVVYKDLKDTRATWASVPGSPVEEIRVSSTILPSCCKGVPVRVSYPVTLRQGTVLGEFEAVEVVDRRPSATSDPNVDVTGGLPDFIQTLLEGWIRPSRQIPDGSWSNC